jgi:predicted nucleic acid-binding protein
MILAILDTNVIIQSAIGSPRSASSRVLRAYTSGRFEIAYSSDTIEELLDVLILPGIRERHQLSDNEILEPVVTLHARARYGSSEAPLSHSLTRDVTDTKFLQPCGRDAGRLPHLERSPPSAAVAPVWRDANCDARSISP